MPNAITRLNSFRRRHAHNGTEAAYRREHKARLRTDGPRIGWYLDAEAELAKRVRR